MNTRYGLSGEIRTCGIFGYAPVAVPGVRLADGAAALHTDRGHSLGSLDSATGGGRLAPPKQVPCFARKMPQSKYGHTKDLAEGYHKGSLRLNGPDDRIRTCGILLPKQALYQTEPHPGIY